MKSPLVHGCYDLPTLQNLTAMGVVELGFDLRGRSPNLIPYHDLTKLLKQHHSSEVILTFQDDKTETILSMLNLLKNDSHKFLLEFRDTLPASFYESLGQRFLWLFNPEGEWEKILSLKNCVGVLLPLRLQEEYQKYPKLWDILDTRDLKIYLHAESLDEAHALSQKSGIHLSFDLSSEVEKSFRTVDQDKLSNLKLWRNLHAHSPQ